MSSTRRRQSRSCSMIYHLARTVGILAVVLISSFAVWVVLPFRSLDRATTPWSFVIPNVVENLSWDGDRPLNVLFMTWGSRGDHQPNVALGLELARRGHNVTVMGLEKYSELIKRHAPLLNYEPLVDDYLWDFARAIGVSDGTDLLPLSVGYVFDTSRQLTGQYIEAARKVNADVVMGSHSAVLMLHHLTAAQALQRPLFFLTHDLTLPTSERSFHMGEYRNRNYGTINNIMNHRLFSLVFGAALTASPTSPFRQLRRELGLKTPWPFMEVLHPQTLQDIPTISHHRPCLVPPCRGLFAELVYDGILCHAQRRRGRPTIQRGISRYPRHLGMDGKETRTQSTHSLLQSRIL